MPLHRTLSALSLAVVASAVTALSAAATTTATTSSADIPQAPPAAVATSTLTSAPAISASPTASGTASVAAWVAAATTAATSTSTPPCSDVRELPYKRVVRDLGMDALTIRQFIGWCSDSRGSAWMNYASAYVWEQYHAKGFAYNAQAGILVKAEPETRGYVVGATRDRTVFSTPVRTTSFCTQGWGKLARDGGESPQGLSSLVC